MRSRLRCRRTTIGPRHSLVISAPEEAPVQETHGLPEELMKRLPAAASELELRAAAAEVVSSALTVLDTLLDDQYYFCGKCWVPEGPL
eukprot:g8478.t1